MKTRKPTTRVASRRDMEIEKLQAQVAELQGMVAALIVARTHEPAAGEDTARLSRALADLGADDPLALHAGMAVNHMIGRVKT